MDGGTSDAAARLHVALQWGHGREAMDGRKQVRNLNTAMKLQWGHGREAMDGGARSTTPTLPPSFNGAMAVRPWMV